MESRHQTKLWQAAVEGERQDEHVKEKRKRRRQKRRGQERRGPEVVIGPCVRAEGDPAKAQCLNSWPGLWCIPCMQPTTSNCSVLSGSV